jgi:thiol-disulfide isomerase/thioredoxin
VTYHRSVRALALLVVAAALVTSCSPAPAGSGPGGGGSLLPEDRLALPEFDLASYRALLEELQGQPVVVNFWAAWCVPCEDEAPHLAEVSRQYEGRVQFLGVDIFDDREAAREFILRYDWPYPSVFDPFGEIRDGLGYLGQPITLIYSPTGRLAFEWVGAVTTSLLRTELDKLIG